VPYTPPIWLDCSHLIWEIYHMCRQ